MGFLAQANVLVRCSTCRPCIFSLSFLLRLSHSNERNVCKYLNPFIDPKLAALMVATKAELFGRLWGLPVNVPWVSEKNSLVTAKWAHPPGSLWIRTEPRLGELYHIYVIGLFYEVFFSFFSLCGYDSISVWLQPEKSFGPSRWGREALKFDAGDHSFQWVNDQSVRPRFAACAHLNTKQST